MDRVKYNSFSEILSDDLCNTGEYLDEAIGYVIKDFFASTSTVIGLKVIASASQDMTVLVQSGRLYQDGKQGVLEATSNAISFIAPHAQYNRIDRVCAKYVELEDTAEIRNVMIDVSSRAVDRKTVNTRIHGTVYFQVVPGVASGSPVAANVPDGWVSLAQVTVRANASFISDTDIMDERPIVQALPGFMDKLNAHIQGIAVHNAGQITTTTINGIKTLQDIADIATTKGNLVGRNTVVTGPLDSSGNAAAIYSDLTTSPVKLKAGTILNFANGFSGAYPVDIPYNVLTDAALALAVADTNTIPLQYTADLCNGGTAISGGDYSAKENAFDNNSATGWASSQIGAAVNSAAYIGYNFGSAKIMRKVTVQQTSSAANSITTAKVQSSTNGTTWTDVATITLVSGANNAQVFYLPATAGMQYWRVLAMSATGSNQWTVTELEFMEALQTHYLLADRATDGTLSLVSAKQKPRAQTTLSDYYTDNVCVGGVAISSGDYYTANPKEYAFDGNAATSWVSLQLDANVANNAYIGYDFGVARRIRRVHLSQYQNVPAKLSNVKVQGSTDAATWVDVVSHNSPTSTPYNIDVPVNTGYRFWRLLATSSITGGWYIFDITMHELAADLIWYNPLTGITQLANAGVWTNVQRIPLGEATVDSAGKIVSYKSYDYGLINHAKFADIRVPDATLTDQPVTLGQFPNVLSGGGWQKLPGGLIIQWSSVVVDAATGKGTCTFPVAFPNGVFQCFATCGALNGSDFTDRSITNETWSKTQYIFHATQNGVACTVAIQVPIFALGY